MFTEAVDTLQHAVHSTAGHDSLLADTLHNAAAAVAEHGAAHGAHGGNDFQALLGHLSDTNILEFPLLGIEWELPKFPPVHVFGIELDLSITKHVVYMWLAAIILGIVVITAARRNMKSRVPKGVGNLIEVFVVFIRDEVVLPNMGPDGMKYINYLLTTFFFILTMNLLGLIPYGASSTGNVSVTAGLAIVAFVMIQLSAIRKQGLKHYIAHLTGGVHWSLWPIMVPIEILGLFTKPFALCIRLFANMSGGHIVLVSLVGLIFIFKSYILAPVPVLFMVGINMLELFVAFLQAYVFTMLTSLFMGLGMQAEHEEGHEAHEEHVH